MLRIFAFFVGAKSLDPAKPLVFKIFSHCSQVGYCSTPSGVTRANIAKLATSTELLLDTRIKVDRPLEEGVTFPTGIGKFISIRLRGRGLRAGRSVVVGLEVRGLF